MYPLAANVPLEDAPLEDAAKCDWPDTAENRRRTVFCALMHTQRIIFKELCRCRLCVYVCVLVCMCE